MRFKFSGKLILRQLKADLIGKDSYRGVTLTYSWLANQLGHLTLGFIPTSLVFTLLKKNSHIHRPGLIAAIGVSGIWFAFELYNFLGPLLLQRKSASKVLFVPGEKKFRFTPSWGNIAFDTATDICFFALGSFLACALLEPAMSVSPVIIALLILLAYPVCYWYLTKMFQQSAQYPFQFRLSQWDLSITEDDKRFVYEFLNLTGPPKHLLVFGSKGSGKTSLAVAIANELSIRHKSCIYTTAMKQFSAFYEPVAPCDGWDWRTSEVLVIDDINPGDPVCDDLVSPGKFLEFIDTGLKINGVNRTILKEKNILWVLGNAEESCFPEGKWKEMLKTIGVPPGAILPVNLLHQPAIRS